MGLARMKMFAGMARTAYLKSTTVKQMCVCVCVCVCVVGRVCIGSFATVQKLRSVWIADLSLDLPWPRFLPCTLASLSELDAVQLCNPYALEIHADSGIGSLGRQLGKVVLWKLQSCFGRRGPYAC